MSPSLLPSIMLLGNGEEGLTYYWLELEYVSYLINLAEIIGTAYPKRAKEYENSIIIPIEGESQTRKHTTQRAGMMTDLI